MGPQEDYELCYSAMWGQRMLWYKLLRLIVSQPIKLKCSTFDYKKKKKQDIFHACQLCINSPPTNHDVRSSNDGAVLDPLLSTSKLKFNIGVQSFSNINWIANFRIDKKKVTWGQSQPDKVVLDEVEYD